MAQPFIAAVKAGLAAVGFPVGTPRAPIAELDPDAAARIAQAREDDDCRCRRPHHHGDREAGGAPGTVHGRLLPARRPPSRSALHRRRVPARLGPARSSTWSTPAPSSTIAQVRRGHRRGRRRRGRRRRRRQGGVGQADARRSARESCCQVADRVEENADLLARLESANTGKPFAVAQDDVASTVDTFRFMAGPLAPPPRRPPATTPRTTCRSSCASRWASSGS